MNNILSKEFTSAVNQIADEKGIKKGIIEEIIGQALAAAYRKDYGEPGQNVRCQFDLDTGRARFFDVKRVVDLSQRLADAKEDDEEEKLIDLKFEIDIKEAKKLIKKRPKIKCREVKPALKTTEDKTGKIFVSTSDKQTSFRAHTEDRQITFQGPVKLKKSDPKKIKAETTEIWQSLGDQTEFGRIAAQTAKQVILQRLREAERQVVFDKFKDKEGELIVGTVQREEMGDIFIDLGQATGILENSEQIRGEDYRIGSRVKALLKAVSIGPKGPEILLSRRDEKVVELLFESEVPEIQAGTVEIVSVAREAGSRSKIAVKANDDNIDPIGSCVGQRGSRVTTVIAELNGEKVDIILYDKKASKFIANALSPAKIKAVKLSKDSQSAVAKVEDDQLSLAIGKAGQNVRLAARLTGWNIDVKSVDGKPKADKNLKKGEKPAKEKESKSKESEKEEKSKPEKEPKEGNKSEKNEKPKLEKKLEDKRTKESKTESLKFKTTM